VAPEHKAVDRRGARGIDPLPPGSESDYDGAYTWPVRFAPKATVVVQNRYVFGGLSTTGPFRLMYEKRGFPRRSLFWRAGGHNRKVEGCDFDDALIGRVQYIVTTARTWSGTVGEADISIQSPPRALPHQIVPTPPATSMGRDTIRWHRTNWKPDQEIALYLAIPTGGTCRRPPLFASEEQARAWIRFARTNGIRRDAVEAMRDTYLARRGARFPDDARNRYFASVLEDTPPATEKIVLPPREAKIVALLDAFAKTLP
jgi:hypothetical protein